MARYVLASSPIHGHVAPMTNIAASLVRAGRPMLPSMRSGASAAL
jgi:hypothetical protein